MITNKIGDNAFSVFGNVQAALKESDIKLSVIYAKHDSHLGDVVAYPSSKIIQTESDVGLRDLVSIFLPIENGGSHSEVQSLCASTIRKNVDESYDFAINHAKPVIIDTFNKVESFINGSSEDLDGSEIPSFIFKINFDKLNPLMNDDTFLDLVSSSFIPTATSYNLITKFEVNDIDLTDFFNFISTGFESIDEEVQKLFTGFEYNDGSEYISVQHTLHSLLDGYDNTSESNIRKYYVAKYLVENFGKVFVKNTEYANAENFKNAASFFANNILSSVKSRQTVVEKKRLVKSLYNAHNHREATVYPEVFSQWIEAGGTTEGIYGAMMETSSDYLSYDFLLENSERCAVLYRDHCMTERGRLLEMRASKLSTYLRRVLKRTIEDNWETFKLTRFSDSCGEFSFLNKITQTDIAGIESSRLYMIIRDVLCQVLWINSPVYDILRSIDKAYALISSGDSESSSAKRALEIAKIYHITDIVSKQMNFSHSD